MERSAVYRRALAPIMIYCGGTGIAGGVAGWLLKIDSTRGFVLFWSGIAAMALVGAFVLVRRQALKDSEPFWSPPTKRVAQALLPAFVIGGCAGIDGVFNGGGLNYDNGGVQADWNLIFIWCLFFGCALHSAGFFMPRGMKLFGWLFILAGFLFVITSSINLNFDRFLRSPNSFLVLLSVLGYYFQCLLFSPHLLMGGIFGGLHFAYGIYLHFTERKNPVA